MNMHINEDRVKYFDLLEYVSKIKVSDKVLFHLKETNENFEEYLKNLAKYTNYDDYAVLYYWLDQNLKELKQSSKIENACFYNKELIQSDLFFEKLSINHERIKRIHKFVCERSNTNKIIVGDYRKTLASVGAEIDGKYQPYWYAPEASDVKAFMDKYLEFYRTNSIKEIFSNPFLKSALAHLLFVRIHPFGDGNGRTARIIQNISFTSGINRIYQTKLKLSPLNISQNININKLTYVDRIDNIYFDLEHDNTDAINRWFEFILNMYDEQLYYQNQRMPNLEKYFKIVGSKKDSIEGYELKKVAQTSGINKLSTK